jgi:hypothetical protein
MKPARVDFCFNYNLVIKLISPGVGLDSYTWSTSSLCATGGFEPVYVEAGRCPFVYLRHKGDEKIIVALNPSGQAVEVTLAPELSTQAPRRLFGVEKVFVKAPDGWRLRLPPVSSGIYQIG